MATVRWRQRAIFGCSHSAEDASSRMEAFNAFLMVGSIAELWQSWGLFAFSGDVPTRSGGEGTSQTGDCENVNRAQHSDETSHQTP